MNVLKWAVFYAACAVFLTFVACRPENNFTTSGDAKLAFSTDTLRFDTVFTEVGSATRYFKVFNRNAQAIRIDRIQLSGKAGATFQLNIDGRTGTSFENVEIAPNDSIYVFAEVTINPNAPLSISPFVISEDLIFQTNGNSQKVVLEAWGQNANYIPNRWGRNGFATISGGDPNRVIELNDKKPYVIYGVLFVDSCVLRFAAGTRIYVHGGIATFRDSSVYRDGIIYVLPNARIESMGTLDNPVVIQGDRLEKEFVDEPDQWAGIILADRSRGNAMTHTTIRNARVGVRVDSSASLNLKNCQIYNTSGSGLLAQNATVAAENCLFYNNYGNSVQLEFGGRYTFSYCTMSSLGSRNAALGANNLRCYDSDGLVCRLAKVAPLSMTMTNCIIYGSKEDEINFFDATKDVTTDFNYALNNCIVRVKDLLKADNQPDFLTKCKDCITASSSSRLFRKPSTGDYQLDTLSIAEQKALPLPAILVDLKNRSRDAQKPDIGCYEFYPR